jgi:hypothetical protein
MSSFLERMLTAIAEWFNPAEGDVDADAESPTPDRPGARRSGKKFQVVRDSGKTGCFRQAGLTRPKNCPRCLSREVTRTPSDRWKCRVCQHQWG